MKPSNEVQQTVVDVGKGQEVVEKNGMCNVVQASDNNTSTGRPEIPAPIKQHRAKSSGVTKEQEVLHSTIMDGGMEVQSVTEEGIWGVVVPIPYG